MLKTVVGIYRNGHIELAETPENVREEAQVIVTFLNPTVIDLPAHGIDPLQAAELRTSLSTFAEDWDSPAMDIYDDYDAAKSRYPLRGIPITYLDPTEPVAEADWEVIP